MSDIAILAPIPHEHLISGIKVAETSGFVAFGSRKWEMFRALDDIRAENPVPVLISV